MFRNTRQLRATFAASAAAAMAISMAGVPAATAQPAQFFVPGSSFGFTVGDQCNTPELDPTSAQYRTQLLEATNAARTENDRAPLRANNALSDVATAWSGAQAEQDKMTHNPNVRGEIPSGWSHWGENVLQNFECATPQELVDQWMASPGHRINLLRADHTDMGMGVAVAKSGKLYATQLFARY